MSEINDFKDLKLWQKGMDIAEKCYLLTKAFPKDELYCMVQQIRRFAASIPANIAEGYGRRSTAEYIRFLNISQGSINELETHIILSQRIILCTRTSPFKVGKNMAQKIPFSFLTSVFSVSMWLNKLLLNRRGTEIAERKKRFYESP